MKRYEIVLNGMLTTLQLSDEDAAARGLTVPAKPVAADPVPVKAKAPANKSRSPRNKQA